MNLTSLLSKDRIKLQIKATKKEDIIIELVQAIKKGPDADLIINTLLKREELGSTGIGRGIAVPHCRSLAVDKLEIVVGRTVKPVNYHAIDRKPVSLFFLIIAPPQDPGNNYLITLGRIVQVARELTKKNEYEAVTTAEEFISLISQIEKDLAKRK